ncbi:hypothetical protein MNBD_GAMMA17-23 [hydrothermal vent metagenome]|uniref:Thiol:disulfide interchange protein DsbA n=1 Tax=hydrothermal vent metagenome TaxID=652676 RepID=A0A3B0ZSM1_9ZZZZ
MKRLTTTVLSLFFVAITAQVTAAPSQQLFQKDLHYKEIDGAISSYQGDKVEVLELLWYGCQTCYVIQGDLENWVAGVGKAINYRRMPAVVEDNMMLLARAFYAAEVLGVMSKIDKPLFSAIHESRRQLLTEAAVAEFFVEQGVAEKDFTRALHSAYVNGKIRRSRIMSQRYGIQGAPSIIVDSKYLVDPSLVRSPEEFIDVVDFLVNKVRTTVRGK